MCFRRFLRGNYLSHSQAKHAILNLLAETIEFCCLHTFCYSNGMHCYTSWDGFIPLAQCRESTIVFDGGHYQFVLDRRIDNTVDVPFEKAIEFTCTACGLIQTVEDLIEAAPDG